MSAPPKRRLPVIAQAAPDTGKQPDWKWALLGVVFFYAILGAALTMLYAVVTAVGHPENPVLLAPLVAAPLLVVPLAAWGTSRLLLGPASAGLRAVRWMQWLVCISLAAISFPMLQDPRSGAGVALATALVLALLVFAGTWLGTRKNTRP